MRNKNNFLLIIFTIFTSVEFNYICTGNASSDSECDSYGNLKPEWGTRSDLEADDKEEYNKMSGCVFYWCEDLGLRFFKKIYWTKIEKRFEKIKKAYALLSKNVPEENIDETDPAYLNQDEITKISRYLKYDFKGSLTVESINSAFIKQVRSYNHLKQMRTNNIFFDS